MSNHRLVCRMIGRLIGQGIHFVVLVCWWVDLLVSWSVGCLVGLLVGCLVV